MLSLGLGLTGLRSNRPWAATLDKVRAAAAAVNGITPHSQAEMASPPTVTPGGSVPSGLSVSVPWTTSGAFRFFGGSPVTYATSYCRFPVSTLSLAGTGGNVGAGKNAVSWRVETVVDAARFAVVTLGYTTIRVIVDGRFVSKAGHAVGDAGGARYTEFDFTSIGGKAARTIVIEGHFAAAFGGVRVAPGDTVTQVSAAPIRAIYIGNSFIETSVASFANDGLAIVSGELIGARDLWQSGLGGTDFINTAGGTKPNIVQRIADVTATGPWDIVYLGPGPINDGAQSASAMTTAVNTGTAAVREALPATLIGLVGPWNVSAPGALSAGLVTIRDAMAAVAPGWPGVTFLDPTSVAYANGDGLHPSTAGHATLGTWLGNATKSGMLGL